jgi:dolichol-phosphate mannosyltransferase
MKKAKIAPSVLVIIAALNEEEGIGPTLAELSKVLIDSQCIVVDGNSVDRTVERAKEFNATVLFQKGLGKGDAIAQAISHVCSNVEYVVFIDADFTYPAKFLPRMIQIMEENPEVGMVTGNRFNSHFELRAMRSPFYIGNRFLAFAQHFVNGVHLRDPLTGLRVIRWHIVKDWMPKSKDFDVEVEMNHRVSKQGYKTIEIPIEYRHRLGEKKLGLRHGFKILARIVSESLHTY